MKQTLTKLLAINICLVLFSSCQKEAEKNTTEIWRFVKVKEIPHGGDPPTYEKEAEFFSEDEEKILVEILKYYDQPYFLDQENHVWVSKIFFPKYGEMFWYSAKIEGWSGKPAKGFELPPEYNEGG